MLKFCSFVRAPIRHLLPGVVLAIGAMSACPAAMALTISGPSASSVIAGSAYSFTPTTTGTPVKSLYFQIKNKPAWATFSVVNGSLKGTPSSAQVGTYGNIQITDTDGKSVGYSPMFSITVKPATSTTTTGTATVSWTHPTQNTNGSTLTNLAGYRLHYGTSSSNLSTVVQIPSAATTSYALKNLTAATWYFAITAYTATGVESAMSQVVSKAVN